MVLRLAIGSALLFISSLAYCGISYRLDLAVDDRSGVIDMYLSSWGSISGNEDLPEPFNPLYFTLNTNSTDVQYIGSTGMLRWFAQVYLNPYENSTHIEVILRSNGITIGNLGSLQFQTRGSGTFAPTVPILST